MGRRRALRWILALPIAACTREPPARERLRYGVLLSADELPLHVMQERGLDRKYGLDLEITTHIGGAKIIEEIAAGRLDASPSVGTVPLLRAARDGTVPERAVAIAVNDIVTPEDRMVAVVVAPHVRHWRDLAGKKVAVNAVNSMAGLAARVRLAREGVTDAQWVEMPMQNHGLALAGGYVSATASNEPFVTQTLLRDDGRLLDWIAGGPPLERAIYTALVVSTALLRAKPALLERLLLAHLEAARWINANHQAARAILGRRLGITDELAQRIQMPRWPSDGRFDPALFAGMQRVFIEGGVVSDIVPLERVHDPALLSRLQVR